MALVVLDASVITGFLDPDDAGHERARAALAGSAHDDRVIPATVLAEVLVHPFRRGCAAVAHVTSMLTQLPVRVEPVTAEMARRAAKLQAAHATLRLGDALVAAAGDLLDAEVRTADRRWSGVSRRVRVI